MEKCLKLFASAVAPIMVLALAPVMAGADQEREHWLAQYCKELLNKISVFRTRKNIGTVSC